LGGGDLDWPQIYKSTADFAEQSKPSIFDFVLVDEGQDLDRNAYRLLRSVSKHVTVCMDQKQQIYDVGADENAILSQLGLRKRNLALLDALRCSPYIISVAAVLVQDTQESRELIAQARTAVGQRETPVVYYARDFDDELAKLVEMIKTRQVAGDRVGVLFPKKRQVMGYSRSLNGAGLIVENQDNLDFSSNTPKLLTYHSAKGLTFDSVLMPCLVDSSFPYSSRAQVERLLFVGVSRAVKWAYFSTREGARFAALDKVTALEGSGQVTILRASTQRDSDPSRLSVRPPSLSEDLLDFL